jgi:hypothetical protein
MKIIAIFTAIILLVAVGAATATPSTSIAAYGQLPAIADLTPPLTNVEWFELAESRSEIDVDEVKEHVNAGLEALADMYAASQELDGNGVADGLTDLSRASDEIKYALSFTAAPSEIAVVGSQEEEDDEEEEGAEEEEDGDEEEQEFSEGVAALEAQRPNNTIGLIPANITTLNINTIEALNSDVAFNTGYMLGLLTNPGGIVSQEFYDKIQETANKLFEINDRLDFSIPMEEVRVIGKISGVPASRQEALMDDATSQQIFIE